MRSGNGWMADSSVSTLASVEYPRWFFFTGGSSSTSKRMWASCLGELKLKGSPAKFVNLGRETVHLGLGLAPQRLQALRRRWRRPRAP